MCDLVDAGTSCKSSSLKRLLLKEEDEENKRTCAEWKRGETPHFLPLSQCTSSTTLQRKYVVRLDVEVQYFSTQMATPLDPYLDFPPAQSVEEYDQQSSYRATPSAPGQWTQYSDILNAPTPGLFGDQWSRSTSVAPHEPRPQGLGFIQLQDWSSDRAYDEVPPTCIRYNVEWKVKINKTIIFKETEENIVLDPSSFWESVLQPRPQEQLRKEVHPPRTVRAKATDVAVSVTGRSERPLVKQFEGTNINWSIVERKLLGWSDLFRNGKKLRVDICLQFMEVEASSRTTNLRNKRQKVGGSTTQHMLAELDAETNAVESSTGKPSAWRHVYEKMRCPGPPCTLGPYCWHDSQTNKRYTLKTHHLRVLIRHVEREGRLETHNDVPDELRQQIYLEEQQSSRNKPSNAVVASANVPPIQVILPKNASPELETGRKMEAKRIDIPGLHDVNVQDYCDWLKSRVKTEAQRDEYQKAADFLIENAFDLDLLYEDQNPAFLVEEGRSEGRCRSTICEGYRTLG